VRHSSLPFSFVMPITFVGMSSVCTPSLWATRANCHPSPSLGANIPALEEGAAFALARRLIRRSQSTSPAPLSCQLATACDIGFEELASSTEILTATGTVLTSLVSKRPATFAPRYKTKAQTRPRNCRRINCMRRRQWVVIDLQEQEIADA